MKTLWTALALTCATAPALYADDMQQALQAYFDENVMNWANDPVLVAAIRAQNGETGGYDQAQIDEMDLLWRGFVGINDAEIIANVLQNPAADFLRDQVSQSGGAITEAFVMDARGLNVAASEATSDYWQGDEAKFTETYLVGGNAVHFGDIELDNSTQEVQGQVSMTIVDQTTNQPIGAITIGVNVTALM